MFNDPFLLLRYKELSALCLQERFIQSCDKSSMHLAYNATLRIKKSKHVF